MRILNRRKNLRGRLRVPGDKSISHRAVMFGALADGVTEIHGFLKGADCLATIDCFRKMGIEIRETEQVIYVHGKGLHGLSLKSTHIFFSLTIAIGISAGSSIAIEGIHIARIHHHNGSKQCAGIFIFTLLRRVNSLAY